jgi:hypothetical protein
VFLKSTRLEAFRSSIKWFGTLRFSFEYPQLQVLDVIIQNVSDSEGLHKEQLELQVVAEIHLQPLIGVPRAMSNR